MDNVSRTIAVLVAFSVLGGCDGRNRPVQPDRFPVAGTVTFDGKPIPDGQIVFNAPTGGSLDIVTIKDGRFEGAAQAGERRVEIFSLLTVKDPMGDYQKNVLPPRFSGKESELTANVKTDGPNEFKFELKSSGKDKENGK